MSVNLLYCEGGASSPDIRVLRAIIPGSCTVRPTGSKYGFGQKVRLSRDITSNSVIAGLRDRDFDEDETPPINSPREWWVENKTIRLGWYWERKEIENYLIDSIIVQKALGIRAPEDALYKDALQESAVSIADYAAARTALATSRVRFSPLPSSWGPERGSDRHKFPDQREEVNCRNAISTIIKQHEQTQTVLENDVLNRFNIFLPLCHPGGYRFQDFLTFFSGKDLLFGMQAALTRFGFTSPFEFRERILKGIENSTEDVWTWLPEWGRLRELINTFSF